MAATAAACGGGSPTPTSTPTPPTSFWLRGPPDAPHSIAGYRTIGATDSLATHVLARLAAGSVFHDFVLDSA